MFWQFYFVATLFSNFLCLSLTYLIHPSLTNITANGSGLFVKTSPSKKFTFAYTHHIPYGWPVIIPCTKSIDPFFKYHNTSLWYFKNNPISFSVEIRAYLDRQKYIIVLSHNSDFYLTCKITTHTTKDSNIYLHKIKFKDPSWREEILKIEINGTIDIVNNIINSQIPQCNDEMVRRNIMLILRDAMQTLCTISQCIKITLDFDWCENMNERSLNASFDVTIRYDMRKIYLYSPVLQTEYFINGSKSIYKLLPQVKKNIQRDILQNVFGNLKSVDPIIEVNIWNKTNIYCLGTPSIFNHHDSYTCELCPKGSVASAYGVPYAQAYMKKTRCSLCPRHSYAEHTGSLVCAPCPSGTYTNTEGATSIHHCIDYNQDQMNKWIVEIIGKRGILASIFAKSEERKRVLLALGFFSPVFLLMTLWLFQLLYINRADIFNDLYIKELQMIEMITMVKTVEAERLRNRQQKNIFNLEHFESE